MSIKDRAKQFMSFQALKGYEEMVEEKTVIYGEQRDLTEDEANLLSTRIVDIKKGDMVKVNYFENGKYITIEGIVTALDLTMRYITIVKKKLSFSNLYYLEKITNEEFDFSK